MHWGLYFLFLANAPSTADLSFMTGTWRLQGTFNPGRENELEKTGSRTCRFVMTGAYVRCDWSMRSERGRLREVVSYHNYNALYGRFESLFIASNWPTKVVTTGTVARSERGHDVHWTTSFTLPDGSTEALRSEQRFDQDHFDSAEYIQLADGASGRWRENYRLKGERISVD